MCDPRGNISTGKKSEKGYPMSTDYFVCDKFPEIIGLYGDKPSKLIIYMPSDDLLDFFDCNFQQYRSDKQKVRVCDGEVCRHILDETVNIKPKEGETELRVKSFEQGQVTACVCNFMPEQVPNPKKPGEMMKNPQLCHYGMIFKAFVANPKTLRIMSPQPIMFRSGSKNTGDTIYTELKRYPRYRGIPFELEVDLVRVGGNKFPVWKLRPYIDYESMVAYQLEGAPVDTGLRALPPPLAPVEDGQFNNQGDYNAGTGTDPHPPKGGLPLTGGDTPSSQNDDVLGIKEETRPNTKAQMPKSNIQDAEFTEVKDAETPLQGEVGVAIWVEIINKFTDVKSLNQWWIKTDMKSVVAEMSSADRERVFAARDRRKAEINNNL